MRKGYSDHKERVCKLVEGFTPQDIDCLLQVCIESAQTFDKEERELGAGLGYVFEAIQDQQQLYLYLTDAYMRADTPYQIYAGQILERLFKIRPVLEVKKFITQYTYNQQNVWLWFFFSLMPETTSVRTLGSRAVAVFGHTGCRDKGIALSKNRFLTQIRDRGA